MSTTLLVASEVMNRAANLLNDPARTDYTYAVQIPYLNMAIDELSEVMEEANISPSNQTSSAPIVIPVGGSTIVPSDFPVPGPSYPFDLVEVQEVGERVYGSNDPYISLARREFLQAFPPNQSLLFWVWEDQIIKFNPNGALGPREIQLRYVKQPIQQATNEFTIITTINARSYLSYKTAAFCAMFIGENESRAAVLETQAEKAVERLTGISNKGRQQIATRHRPFRAAYKMRGGF